MKTYLLFLTCLIILFGCNKSQRNETYKEIAYYKNSFDNSEYQLVKQFGDDMIKYKYLTTFNTEYNGVQGGVTAEIDGYKWEIDYNDIGMIGRCSLKIVTLVSVYRKIYHMIYTKADLPNKSIHRSP